MKKESTVSKLFVPAVSLSRFSSMTSSILTGLLLIEIATTFNVDVGVAAQIRTLASTMAMVFAVVMAFITVKIRTKTLLITGLGILTLSAIGCILSTSMNMMLISYTLTGVSTALIVPMCLTAIGENLRLDQRSRAISWLMTGAALAYVIGAPIINFLSDIGDWRTSFLGYVVPTAILSLVLVWFALPFSEVVSQRSTDNIFSGFKAIFSNRSAIACMLGNALISACYQAILYFSSSFYRQEFLTSKSIASLLIVGSASSFVLGSQIGGRFVNRFGRKMSTSVPAVIGGLLTMSFMIIPSLAVSVLFRFLGSLVVSISFIGSRSLTLEQEPGYRGAMMSLNTASQNLGTLIGTGFGGLMILRYSYSYLGFGLGILGILSGIVYWLFSIDPTET